MVLLFLVSCVDFYYVGGFFVFVFFFVLCPSPLLPMCRGCPFLIDFSVFSNVNLCVLHVCLEILFVASDVQ